MGGGSEGGKRERRVGRGEGEGGGGRGPPPGQVGNNVFNLWAEDGEPPGGGLPWCCWSQALRFTSGLRNEEV